MVWTKRPHEHFTTNHLALLFFSSSSSIYYPNFTITNNTFDPGYLVYLYLFLSCLQI